MSSGNKTYSVGELARATGLTVRTLQHYDNIGLLPPSGRTEGGRRYYTDGDMLRLTQIVFYKSVGISLSDIREKLSAPLAPTELEEVFNRQVTALLKKMDALHMALSVLGSTIGIIKSGGEPPFEALAQLIQAMDGSSLNDWVNFEFDSALNKSLAQSGLTTLNGAMDFYHVMRELMVEAVALSNANTATDSPAALALGRRWWEEIILKVTTGGDEAALAALAVNDNRAMWPEADRRLFEAAEPFIEAALAAYIDKNKIAVPASLSGGDSQ